MAPPSAPSATAASARHPAVRKEHDERVLPPFEKAIECHRVDVWRFAISQVGPERADDLFQETMLAALAAYPTLRDPTVMRSWLFRIVARKAVDLFRARARDAIPVAEPDAGSVPEHELRDDELWDHVRALPDKQRHAVTLRYLLDLEYAEIAAMMQISAEAARRNVFEAVKGLRDRLPRRTVAASSAPREPVRLVSARPIGVCGPS